METNKQLQLVISKAIGKDYFKLELGQRIQISEDGAYDIFIKQNQDGYYLATTGQWYRPTSETKPLKILGTEPTLADVLLAIDKSNIKGSIDFHGNIGILPFRGHTDYDLTKSLFQQSPEVKEFIINILSN
jgi:hypothetical protein